MASSAAALPTPQSIEVNANITTAVGRLWMAVAWVWGWGAMYTGVMTLIHNDFGLVNTIYDVPAILFWFVALPYRWYNAYEVKSLIDTVRTEEKTIGRVKLPDECGWFYGFFNNLKSGPTYCRTVATLNQLKTDSPTGKIDVDQVLQCAS